MLLVSLVERRMDPQQETVLDTREALNQVLSLDKKNMLMYKGIVEDLTRMVQTLLEENRRLSAELEALRGPVSPKNCSS